MESTIADGWVLRGRHEQLCKCTTHTQPRPLHGIAKIWSSERKLERAASAVHPAARPPAAHVTERTSKD